MEVAFRITNKTGECLKITSSITEAKGPIVGRIDADETVVFFKLAEPPSIVLEPIGDN